MEIFFICMQQSLYYAHWIMFTNLPYALLLRLSILHIIVAYTVYQGPVSERRLSENSEYVNPEMRETLGFPFQNGRFVKPEKAG